MKTLVDTIISNKGPNARIHFIRGAEEEFALSYETLKQRALGLRAFLHGQGVTQGDEIILLSQRNEAFIEGFWAAVLGGNPAIPLAFGISDEHKWKLFRIWQQLQSPWLLLDATQKERLEKFVALNGLNSLWQSVQKKSIVIEEIPPLTVADDFIAVEETDTAIIQFSSGTTSSPKGIVLSHKNILTNIRGIIKGMAMTEADSTFSWMPLTHDMGLIGFHLTPFVQGVDQYLMPTDLFIRRPWLWFQKISQVRSTVTCSPNFGYQHYLSALERNQSQDALALNHVRLIFNGAEPIAVPLVQQFLKKMQIYGLNDTAMFTVYGLAEASLAVAFPEPGKRFRYVTLDRERLQMNTQVQYTENGVSFAVEGKPIAGCFVRIVGPDQSILSANHIGKIEIKGENVTKGYLKQEELNREVFHEDWLDTGDLGFLTTDGELVVTGRWKDIIFVNGQNYYPHDLEQILQSKGVTGAGRVAVTSVRGEGEERDKILVFILYKGRLPDFVPIINAVKGVVSEQLGIEVQEVLPINQLPKTTSGKIQRYQLSSRYQQGDFNQVIQELLELSAMDDKGQQGVSTIEKTLKGICDGLLANKRIDLDENIFEIGTTSLVLAQIHQQIEEIYPGKVEVTDFFDYPTIRQLASYINGKK
ncbi:non-ribosomal peptide synthetase [Olivibacter sp. SA151]|uniref:non-ribosomal peptide synthetase n=1 Tax=Olivibacter jilunii TaxID=985016 RepID=UPI003F14E7FA